MRKHITSAYLSSGIWKEETLDKKDYNKFGSSLPRSNLIKRLPENMQQILQKTLMRKCDFNKVPKQFW